MRSAKHAPRDSYNVLERRHGFADVVEVKLWKKSCGDNCPGFYKVYMNCEGHFGGGGMGPHCYLQFWCTKSNTDETYHDC